MIRFELRYHRRHYINKMSAPSSPTPSSPPPYKEDEEPEPIEFVPLYDQEIEFDFDLLNRKDEGDEYINYDEESLTKYFNSHFFLHKGYVYKWAGERVDTNHPFFKKPQTMKKTLKWFDDQRGRTWTEQVKVSAMPEHHTLTKELSLNIPEGINEFPNIQPILDFDKDFCGSCEKQMKLFHQYLGMKLKYPLDIKRLSDKMIVFSGPQGNGKTTQITHKLHEVFQHQPYPAHMKDYGNKSIYNHATALNIVVDDAFSKVTTGPQTNTVKEMTSKRLVGGNIKNRSSTWFFVNDTHMHNIPMKNGRRCHIFRTGAKYNRRWDLLKVVEETTTKYRDEYVAYLLSTVEGMENLNDCFGDYERDELKKGGVDVELDPNDSSADMVRNYFKKHMTENPSKYTKFPFKLPKAKQIVADIQTLYESPRKIGMTAAVTGLMKAVVPKLRNNNKHGLYVVDSEVQLRSMAACCQIYGDSFDVVFYPEPTLDDTESDDEIDEAYIQEQHELNVWQEAKQEEIKVDREKQLEIENELLRQQMQQGMQMIQQMQQVMMKQAMQQREQPIIIPQQKALPAPKQKAKLKVNFRKK